MSEAGVVAIVVALISLIPIFATYLITARRLKGKVQTTEARDLWNEARSIRKDYANRLHEADEKITRLEHKNTILTEENIELRSDLRGMKRDLEEANRHIAELSEKRNRG